MPQEKKWTSGKIAAIIGTVAGTVSILAFIGTIYTNLDKWIVTDAELKLSEDRIIQKIEDEAVKTRTVYITEMIERKTKLESQLEDETVPGRIEALIRQIETLDKRIEQLRGR